MIFFFGENFPAVAGELLKAFDGDNQFEPFAYPPGTPMDEWVACIAKAHPKRFIVTLGNGMVRNKVARKMLREFGCPFICFGGAWESAPWPMLAWKLIRACYALWPE